MTTTTLPSSKRIGITVLSVVTGLIQLLLACMSLGLALEEALDAVVLAYRIALPLALILVVTLWLLRPRYSWGNRAMAISGILFALIWHVSVEMVPLPGYHHVGMAFFEILFFGLLALIMKLEKAKVSQKF